ncbi:MAG: hypothetical protein Q9181_002663 [Wetmoreana brouardii]
MSEAEFPSPETSRPPTPPHGYCIGAFHSTILQAVRAYVENEREASDSKINLPEDDPYLVSLMLQFLYIETYTVDTEDEEKHLDPDYPTFVLKHHVQLYSLGDKYNIPLLCRLAAYRFRQYLHTGTHLAEAFDCVPWIYDNIPDNDRALRNHIIKEIAYRAEEINSDPMDRAALMDLIHHYEQFREDMFTELLQRSAKTGDEDSFVAGSAPSSPGSEDSLMGELAASASALRDSQQH